MKIRQKFFHESLHALFPPCLCCIARGPVHSPRRCLASLKPRGEYVVWKKLPGGSYLDLHGYKRNEWEEERKGGEEKRGKGSGVINPSSVRHVTGREHCFKSGRTGLLLPYARKCCAQSRYLRNVIYEFKGHFKFRFG